jgi:hypothetical protein
MASGKMRKMIRNKPSQLMIDDGLLIISSAFLGVLRGFTPFALFAAFVVSHKRL